MSTPGHLDETLPAVPESVAFARALVDVVDPPLPEDARRCARLLMSEVVTNAIRHGRGTAVQVHVERDQESLRIEVHDDGAGFPPEPVEADPLRGSGWGLQLVQRLARRWGVDGSAGTTVWFELAAPAHTVPGALVDAAAGGRRRPL